MLPPKSEQSLSPGNGERVGVSAARRTDSQRICVMLSKSGPAVVPHSPKSIREAFRQWAIICSKWPVHTWRASRI